MSIATNGTMPCYIIQGLWIMDSSTVSVHHVGPWLCGYVVNTELLG